jgi:hypothetical protein
MKYFVFGLFFRNIYIHMHWSESTLKAALTQKRNRKEETFIVNNLLEYLYSETMLVHRVSTCCHLNRINFTTDALTNPLQLNIYHTSINIYLCYSGLRYFYLQKPCRDYVLLVINSKFT